MIFKNVPKICFRLLVLFSLIILVACGNNLAPVTERKWHDYLRHKNTHIVKSGETLYSIAFHYDTDFKTLARLNRIQAPYVVRPGQILYLQNIDTKMRPMTNMRRFYPHKSMNVKTKTLEVSSPSKRYIRSVTGWVWPVSGNVISFFSPEQGKKGINIASRKGEKIIAAFDGVVAYAGNGLAGYGNLIIIKHKYKFLTAYGNNARILVSEGQHVKTGQSIAVAGIVDHKYTGLHFEIRKSGVPVNPLHYLPKG